MVPITGLLPRRPSCSSSFFQITFRCVKFGSLKKSYGVSPSEYLQWRWKRRSGPSFYSANDNLDRGSSWSGWRLVASGCLASILSFSQGWYINTQIQAWRDVMGWTMPPPPTSPKRWCPPKICECELIWKKDLCRCNYVKEFDMRSSRIRVCPESNNEYP